MAGETEKRGTCQVYIHPTAVVEEGASIGEGTKIWHFAHVRSGAVIGRNCVIGKCVYVDTGVKIGNGVKIQNFSSVYRGVTIEDDVFIGPLVTFTNDKYPRAFSRDWKVIPTLVKKGASIGAGSVIVCGVTLGEYCMVGAGSVVTRDVPPYALVYGNPARVVGFVCICGFPLKKVEKRGNKPFFVCERCGRHLSLKDISVGVLKTNNGDEETSAR